MQVHKITILTTGFAECRNAIFLRVLLIVDDTFQVDNSIHTTENSRVKF